MDISFRKLDGSKPLVIQKPQGLYFSDAQATHEAERRLTQLLEKQVTEVQDKALTIGLEEFRPGLVAQAGLQNLKKHLRFSEVGNGDHMIYWEATGEVIMFLEAPQINYSSLESPKVTVGYRTPTPAERTQLAALGRNAELLSFKERSPQ